MLIDFMVATAIAVIGLLALSNLTTQTLNLNHQTEAYWVAGNAVADFRGRWQLARAEALSAANQDLCAAPDQTWQSTWCSALFTTFDRFSGDPRVCVVASNGRWQVRMAWSGGDCVNAAHPYVGTNL